MMSSKIEELKKRYREGGEYRNQHEHIVQVSRNVSLEVIEALMEEIETLQARLDGHSEA